MRTLLVLKTINQCFHLVHGAFASNQAAVVSIIKEAAEAIRERASAVQV